MKKYIRYLSLAAGIMTLAFCMSTGDSHPSYLHALDNLAAARQLIVDNPADRATTVNQDTAVFEIDRAVGEIKYACLEVGKNIESHPAMDGAPEGVGIYHQALQYLNRARINVDKDEDYYFAQGLRNHSINHIDLAIAATLRALVK
ncbi:MAG: hypothetical protein ABSG63_00735 [Spirochaetia bacterium]|jgi:hypothetical protein